MLYLIDDSNAVEAFESLDPNVQDVTGAVVFANPAQLEAATKDWPLSRFADVWNDMAGGPPLNLKPVKKFENRVTAIARIWNAVRRLGNPTTDDPEETANAAPTPPAVAPEPAVSDNVSMPKQKATRAKRAPKAAKPAKTPKVARTPKPAPKSETAEYSPRAGSKMKLVIGMLSRKGGASVDEISEKTGGWKAWTIRAFISATVGKKLGFKVESSKEGKGPRRYRIAA